MFQSLQSPSLAYTLEQTLDALYTDGISVLKEIFQNANDAQATEVTFGIIDPAVQPSHLLLQHRYMFFMNNGSFNEDDERYIGMFGQDAKVGDLGKLGKFGLGQKSVFHLCEMFVYVARQTGPDGTSKIVTNLLSPWQHPDDSDLPQYSWGKTWIQSSHIEGEFKAYAIQHVPGLKEKLQNEEPFFVLCLPLREMERLNFTNKEKVEDCVSLTQQSFDKISDVEDFFGFSSNNGDYASLIDVCYQVLPIFNSMRRIDFYMPNETGLLEEIFHCEKSSLHEYNSSLTYPKSEIHLQNKIAENRQPLEEHYILGKTEVFSSSIGQTTHFSGKETLHRFDMFDMLVQKTTEAKDELCALQKNPYWPTIKKGRSKNVPDKALPHSACLLVATPDLSPKIKVSWNVFLPLSGEGTKFEESIDGSQYSYSVVLHGYFFLDSGRKEIPGWKSIQHNEIPTEIKNEKDLGAYWNSVLALKGTLPILIEVVDTFFTHHQSHDPIAFLNGFKRLKVWMDHKKWVCHELWYLHTFLETGFRWQKHSKTNDLLFLSSDVSIDDLTLFEKGGLSFLSKEEIYVVNSVAPNLFSGPKYKWTSGKLQLFFSGLDTSKFDGKWDSFLQIINSPQDSILNNTDIQDCLCEMFAKHPVTDETTLAKLLPYFTSQSLLRTLADNIHSLNWKSINAIYSDVYTDGLESEVLSMAERIVDKLLSQKANLEIVKGLFKKFNSIATEISGQCESYLDKVMSLIGNLDVEMDVVKNVFAHPPAQLAIVGLEPLDHQSSDGYRRELFALWKRQRGNRFLVLPKECTNSSVNNAFDITNMWLVLQWFGLKFAVDVSHYDTYRKWLNTLLNFAQINIDTLCEEDAFNSIALFKQVTVPPKGNVTTAIVNRSSCPDVSYTYLASSIELATHLALLLNEKVYLFDFVPPLSLQNLRTRFVNLLSSKPVDIHPDNDESLKFVGDSLLKKFEEKQEVKVKQALRHLLHGCFEQRTSQDDLYIAPPDRPMLGRVMKHFEVDEWRYIKSPICDLLSNESKKMLGICELTEGIILQTLNESEVNLSKVEWTLSAEEMDGILPLDLEQSVFQALPFHETVDGRRVALTDPHVYLLKEESCPQIHPEVAFVKQSEKSSVHIKYKEYATDSNQMLEYLWEQPSSEANSALILSLLGFSFYKSINPDLKSNLRTMPWFYIDNTVSSPEQWLLLTKELSSKDQELLISNYQSKYDSNYNAKRLPLTILETLRKAELLYISRIDGLFNNVRKDELSLQNTIYVFLEQDKLIKESFEQISPDFRWIDVDGQFVCPAEIYRCSDTTIVDPVAKVVHQAGLYLAEDVSYRMRRVNHYQERVGSFFNDVVDKDVLCDVLEMALHSPKRLSNEIEAISTYLLEKFGNDISLSSRWYTEPWVFYEYQDCSGWVSPQNLIHISPTSDEELSRLIYTQDDVTLHMVRPSLHNLLKKFHFDKNKMTADKLVDLLSDDQFAIGALDVESEADFDLRNWYDKPYLQDLFPIFPFMEVLKNSELRQAVETSILRDVSDDMLIDIFSVLSEQSFKDVENFVSCYVKSLSFERLRSILHDIKLPNTNGDWRSPTKLTTIASSIDKEYCVWSGFSYKWEGQESWDDVSFVNSDDNTDIEPDDNQQKLASPDDLQQYFSRIDKRVFHRALGMYLRLIRRFDLVGRYITDDVQTQNDLLEDPTAPDDIWNKDFQVTIRRADQTIEEKNLLGQTTAFPQSVDGRELLHHTIPPSRRRFSIVLLYPPDEPHNLDQMFQDSAYDIMTKCYKQTYTKEAFARHWDLVLNRSQMDIHVAKKMILNQSRTLLSRLGVLSKSEVIKYAVKALKDAERKIAEGEVHHARLGKSKSIEQHLELLGRKEECTNSLLGLLSRSTNRSNTEEIELSDILKRQMRNHIVEQGYEPQSVPFELLQNADDASVEMIDILKADNSSGRYSKFAISFMQSGIWVLHTGRPINAFKTRELKASQMPDYKSRFEQDLEKMLSLSISDKEDGQTGKFGLGFKSVFTITETPYIWSGDLEFAIESGFIPVKLPSDNEYRADFEEQLQRHGLLAQRLDSTGIFLPYLEGGHDGIIMAQQRLRENILYIPFMSRRLDTISLFVENKEEDILRTYEAKKSQAVTVVSQRDGSFILLLSQTGRKSVDERNQKILFHCTVEDEKLESCLTTQESIWVTVPLPIDVRLPFLLNGDFHITPGRDNFSNKDEANKSAFMGLGNLLAEHLSSGLIFEELEQHGVTENMFKEFLWGAIFDLGIVSGFNPEFMTSFREGFLQCIGLYSFIPSGLPQSPHWESFLSLKTSFDVVDRKLLRTTSLNERYYEFNSQANKYLLSEVNYYQVFGKDEEYEGVKRTLVDCLNVLPSEIPIAVLKDLEQAHNLFDDECFQQLYYKLFESQSGEFKRINELILPYGNSSLSKTYQEFAPSAFLLNQEYGESELLLYLQSQLGETKIPHQTLLDWTAEMTPRQKSRVTGYFNDVIDEYDYDEASIIDLLQDRDPTLGFVPNFQEELESETEDDSWDPFDFDDDFLAPDAIQPSEQAFETSLVNILRDVPHQNWLYESDERINVFHVTHVENAVSILEEQTLYSRAIHSPTFNSASTSVLERTDPDVLQYSRFYFRPKTPTQFHNQNFGLRKNIDAMCPVPVLIAVDLEELLEQEQGRIFVSRTSLAKSTEKGNTTAFLNQLSWNDLYQETPHGVPNFKSIVQRECVVQDKVSLDRLSFKLYVQSDLDAQTLRTLLKEKGLLEQHKSYIRVRPEYFFDRANIQIAYSNKKTSVQFSKPIRFKSSECLEVQLGTEYHAEINADCFTNQDHILTINAKSSNCTIYLRDIDQRWLVYKSSDDQ